MRSPDGNGRSTGEGRKGALLVLHGGRRGGREDTGERASAVPSSNALRPDSNLNLGWYRPAEPVGSRPPGVGADDRSTAERSTQNGGHDGALAAAAARLDLGPGPALLHDADEFPLGARRQTRVERRLVSGC